VRLKHEVLYPILSIDRLRKYKTVNPENITTVRKMSISMKLNPLLSVQILKRMVYEKNPSIKKINRGKELYKVACYDCHGPKGHGDGPLAKDLNPKPVNLKRLVKEAPHFTLHLSISQWSGKNCLGWKNKSLNEKDIRDISLYLALTSSIKA
jgi:mono/diheme cytochrome c family protein